MFTSLNHDWQDFLGKDLLKSTERSLGDFLDFAYENNVIFPERENIFTALNLSTPKAVKVVILGQDPYHGEGEAEGIAFSVPNGVKCPPSLRNILTELSNDLGTKTSGKTDLSPWGEQGVLLLNTVLTVQKDTPNAHQKRGWEGFTKAVILKLAHSEQPIVFMLWGKPAKQYKPLIDETRHLVLIAPHPSPLSSYRGFFGCKHFSKANEWLTQKGIKQINWDL